MSLIASHVSKVIGAPPVRVLTDVSLTINDGEFVSIVGRSGSGKSTLLYLLSSLDNPTDGYIEIGGRILGELSSEDLHQFRNEQMGFVFQFHYLIAELTALENVLMPTFKFRNVKDASERALSLLDQFGLKSKSHRLPRQLSGGEQQRVAIARALIMKPRYLFADEPTGNLDSASGNTVMDIIRRINREYRTTVIMVTHDPDYANLATRQIHLVDGRLS